MEDVEAVGNLRAGTAVFNWNGRRNGPRRAARFSIWSRAKF